VSRRKSRPGADFRVALLEGGDGAGLLHGQPDIVETVQQAVALEVVEVELDHAAVRATDFLGFEIDPFRKHCLLNGLDDIGLTMEKAPKIDAYEEKLKQRAWA
jgi:3-isopropylmalate dehydratase small subunit